MAGYKVNSKNSGALQYISDKWAEKEIRETLPFTIATNIKYLGVTLIAQVKDLYDKNYKSLKKEIEEDIWKWKDLPCPWIGRIHIIKMTVLIKTIYRFNAIPIKISTQFFADLERTLLNFTWKSKKPTIAQTNSVQKWPSGGITICDLKLYSRTVVMETVRFWPENRHMDQGNQIEDTDINPHTYEYLIFDKGAKMV